MSPLLMAILIGNHWKYVTVLYKRSFFFFENKKCYADFLGNDEVAVILIQKGADVNIVGQNGATPLIRKLRFKEMKNLLLSTILSH